MKVWKRLRWYFLVHKWWRDAVPWWLLEFCCARFNWCRANMVAWKMLDGEDELHPTEMCGWTSVPDGKGGWKTAFDESCYCGAYTDEATLKKDAGRSSWCRRQPLEGIGAKMRREARGKP